MKEQLERIETLAKQEMESCTDIKALDDLRVKYLGKKGELTAILKQMGKLSAEERPVIGQLANQVRADIEEALSTKLAALKANAQAEQLKSETIDITLPGKTAPMGKLHPLTKVENEIREIFMGMGFDIADGPEVDDDYHVFEALNLPPDHPARDTQDTFYIEGTDETVLLRTQTSSVQVHVMETQKPPIRIISPGRVFRSDAAQQYLITRRIVAGAFPPILYSIVGQTLGMTVNKYHIAVTFRRFSFRIAAVTQRQTDGCGFAEIIHNMIAAVPVVAKDHDPVRIVDTGVSMAVDPPLGLVLVSTIGVDGILRIGLKFPFESAQTAFVSSITIAFAGASPDCCCRSTGSPAGIRRNIVADFIRPRRSPYRRIISGVGQIILIISGIKLFGNAQLFKVAQAAGLLGTLPCCRQRRQQHCR